MAFEINGRTGEIVEADCSGTLELTRSFVRRMFVGKRILEDDQKIEEEIRRRYFGSSVKALLVAYRDARDVYKRQLPACWPAAGPVRESARLTSHGKIG